MGFKKGDHVGIWGPNMREWVITQFATAKAGLILVSALRLILANAALIHFTRSREILACIRYDIHKFLDTQGRLILA